MEFNKLEYATLVKEAMGNRNAKRFADELGTSPSTITRILKQENKSPSSRQLLKKIAEYSRKFDS